MASQKLIRRLIIMLGGFALFLYTIMYNTSIRYSYNTKQLQNISAMESLDKRHHISVNSSIVRTMITPVNATLVSTMQNNSMKTEKVHTEKNVHKTNSKVLNISSSGSRKDCDGKINYVGRRKPKMAGIRMDMAIGNAPNTMLGGSWKPTDCKGEQKIAIIIPYRDREEHLNVLLYHLHPILQKQKRNYRVFVVEQLSRIGESKQDKYGIDNFNKGAVMNAGVTESLKMDNFSCIIFHDVDLIPEDDRTPYQCEPNNIKQPVHLSVLVNTLRYKLPYVGLIGGVLAVPVPLYKKVNGFSNKFWGRGAEDDDMFHRLDHIGAKLLRPQPEISRYSMIKHKRRTNSGGNLCELLEHQEKHQPINKDGLSSVKYKVTFKRDYKLFTHIMVDIDVSKLQVKCKYTPKK